MARREHPEVLHLLILDTCEQLPRGAHGDGPYLLTHQAPQSWTERAYHKLTYYKGWHGRGHYAAWEQPEIFSKELRAGFRPLRKLS